MPTMNRTTVLPHLLWRQCYYDCITGKTTCGEANTTFTIGKAALVWNDKQRRVKPLDLLNSLTSLAKQTRTSESYGLYLKLTKWSTLTKVYTRWDYMNEQCPYSAFVLGNPDWAGPMRLKIKADAVNLADTIGEWRESIDALKHGAEICRDAYRAVKTSQLARKGKRLRLASKTRKGRRGGIPRNKHKTPLDKALWNAAQDVVGADLAIKFGVTPTLKLASDLQEALARYATEGVMKRLVVTVGETRSGTYAPSNSIATYEWSTDVSKRAVMYVKVKPYSPVWTAGNPAEALWAGMRLSFMIDWFWNFGNYLSSIDALESVTMMKGTLTTKTFVRAKAHVRSSTWSVEKPYRYASQTHERELVSTVPFAQLPDVSLPFDDPHAMGKLWSSLEILSGLRRKTLRNLLVAQ